MQTTLDFKVHDYEPSSTQSHLNENSETEIWKPIPNYEMFYEASSLGRVKRIPTIVNSSNGGKVRLKERIMKINCGSNGYFSVMLSANNIKKTHSVHCLVASAFLKRKDSDQVVNHKNGIKTDNNVSNLEWCTYSENERHSIRVLRKIPRMNHLINIVDNLGDRYIIKGKETFSKLLFTLYNTILNNGITNEQYFKKFKRTKASLRRAISRLRKDFGVNIVDEWVVTGKTKVKSYSIKMK